MKSIHFHKPLFVIACIAMVSVAILYVYMYRTVDMSAERVIVARSAVHAHEQSDLEEKRIVSIYGETVHSRARLSSFFVPHTTVVAFIETLEHLGPQAGSSVTLSRVSLDDVSKQKTGLFSRVSAHVDAVGSWAAVMRTLALSETLPFQSKVSNVRLDASVSNDPKNSRRVWRVSFDVEADTLLHATSSAPRL